jgi:preprotein translocase subunit SecG
MFQQLITILHGILCVGIVGLVLLQRGKGADAGAGFGAGASGTVFGARGSATFFSKLTAVLATLFFMTSLSLAWFATRPQARQPDSLVDKLVTEPATSAPASAPAGVDSDAVPKLTEPAPEPAPAPSAPAGG